MKKILKNVLLKFLLLFGKRITNTHAPAKPYSEGVQFLKRIGVKPDLIIDVGVADGTPELTDVFTFNKNTYLLIEANPKYHHYLEKLESQNREKVIIEKSFCGSDRKTVKFNLNKSGYSSSKYAKYRESRSIDIPSLPLDDIIMKHNLSEYSSIMLKIDVEGAELDVLKGAIQTLKKCDVVIMETWINVPESNSPATFAALVTLMDNHGFVVFDFLAGCNHQSGLLAHLDTVFVRHDSNYRKKTELY